MRSKGGGKGRRGEAFGFSQRCDMFVMFSHWGDAQTFHFTVWHLHQAAKCGTADTAPDEGTLQGEKSHQDLICCGACGLRWDCTALWSHQCKHR